MTTASRRTFVLSAAAAGAALGLDKPVAFIGSAEAQKAPAATAPTLLDKGFAKFKIGDIEVIQVFDGTASRVIDDKFVKNATVDQLRAALKKSGQPAETTFQNTFTVTFIRSKGKLTMFDSSTGGQLAETAGLMMKRNMYAAGIKPQDISTIIVTHFHPDHISGMISKETNSKVFPDAQVIVPAAELAFWNDATKVPEAAKALGARVQASLGKWKEVRQIADGEEVIPGVRALATHGHTPGHTSYIVSSGRKQMLVSADITGLAAVNLANPSWHVVFDMDAQMAEASRRKALDRAIADKMIVTGYHWGLPGAGTIKKDGAGYALVPVKV
jgi:glyoxylase-like metal-dependent hydrolase (beta-lactamase superfamily II)